VCSKLVVKVGHWVVGIFVIDIVIVTINGRMLLVLAVSLVQSTTTLLSLLLWTLVASVVRRGTSNDRLADPANPVVLFTLRIGIQQIGDFGRRNLKGIPLAGLQIGRFDGRAQCQIDHSVGCRILVGTIKEFGTLEQKETAAPVLEK